MRENCTYGSMRGSRRKTAKSVLRVVEDRAGVPDNKGRPALLYTLLGSSCEGRCFIWKKFELGSVAPQEEKAESFFVGGDSTCRVVATLADGLVVSNSYGYYCYGMDCGVIRVTVTKDRRIKIVDKYYKYDPHYD